MVEKERSAIVNKTALNENSASILPNSFPSATDENPMHRFEPVARFDSRTQTSLPRTLRVTFFLYASNLKVVAANKARFLVLPQNTHSVIFGFL